MLKTVLVKKDCRNLKMFCCNKYIQLMHSGWSAKSYRQRYVPKKDQSLKVICYCDYIEVTERVFENKKLRRWYNTNAFYA